MTRVRHVFGVARRDERGNAVMGELRQEAVHVYAVAEPLALSDGQRRALFEVALSIGWEPFWEGAGI